MRAHACLRAVIFVCDAGTVDSTHVQFLSDDVHQPTASQRALSTNMGACSYSAAHGQCKHGEEDRNRKAFVVHRVCCLVIRTEPVVNEAL
ncbi:uncharacterized protein L969DRAFT_87675 [Mixia osmundae IAM 14324]|uniref:uncharacterized protein n=1 Tax=Mixia osmundae (strain CBS 9802 / IAM 14324 / JCM 22182 / KY 12970) TaxID=764103 RepID=UPI0004A54CB4|nr:uncharacterized protein L969DRAFT_87675 [Mixia osmundae IAM 14324]KEI39682.1 hypothetical protein L969DRAFT_87675 [Mixia osmundae IAM 14324]